MNIIPNSFFVEREAHNWMEVRANFYGFLSRANLYVVIEPNDTYTILKCNYNVGDIAHFVTTGEPLSCNQFDRFITMLKEENDTTDNE
jgi:hypothetical protein